MKPDRLLIPLGFVAICLIWGSTWLAIKWGYDAFPPLLGSSIRFLLASLIFAGILAVRKTAFPSSRTEWKAVWSLGILGFGLAYGVVYLGQQYIPSALASILFTTYPFWVAIGNALILKETRMTPSKILALILGFAGIVLIFGRKLTGFDLSYVGGMSLILLSSLIQAINLITIRHWATRLSPLMLNFLSMAIGGGLLLIWSLLTESWSAVHFSVSGLLSTLYLTVVGSVLVFTIYWWLLSRVQAVTLSLSAFITPVVAVFVGYFLGGETLDLYVYAGGAIAISGILVYNLTDRTHSRNAS